MIVKAGAEKSAFCFFALCLVYARQRRILGEPERVCDAASCHRGNVPKNLITLAVEAAGAMLNAKNVQTSRLAAGWLQPKQKWFCLRSENNCTKIRLSGTVRRFL